jgi:hypothetical protein
MRVPRLVVEMLLLEIDPEEYQREEYIDWKEEYILILGQITPGIVTVTTT